MTTEFAKDSVEILSNDFVKSNLDRKGKLIKGTVSAYGSIPTIPSKYLTIITDNKEKKGFQKSSKRFQYSCTDTPGPGAYVTTKNLNEQIKKPSDSKKGYGNFASSASRSETRLNSMSTPGAGAYEIKNAVSFGQRKDFSHGYSSVFSKPIATNKPADKDKENELPAPNAYDLEKSKKYTYKSNNVAADFAFKSKTKREFMFVDKTTENVAPNSYQVNDEFKHTNTKVPYSSFKSNTQRHSFAPNSEIPAPNHYRPYEQSSENVERQLFPRRHYLAISAPAVPMAPELPLPGPGAYNVRDFREPDKKYMSSAVFVSSTGRLLNTLNSSQAGALPGPANYFPIKNTKQSFHYNHERKWI